MKKYLLGFDIGTGESKGSLTDIEGNLLATAARAHDLISPKPGFAEHDPLQYIEDFKNVTKELLFKANAKPDEIAGIGISAVMAAVTFTDENYNPLRNAILYGIDTRCIAQAEEITEKIGKDKMLEKWGTVATIEHYGSKILWVRENEPEIFEKTKHITFDAGFLVGRLTGHNVVDPYSVTSAIPMLDYESFSWGGYSEMICNKECLPEITKSTYSIAGTVSKKAAEEMGLFEGIPVITGTIDAGAEAVSVGVIKPGDTMLMYGSTAFMIAVSQKAANKFALKPYTIDNMVCTTAGMATTGSLTKWLRNEIGKDYLEKEKAGGENAFTALFKEAEGIAPGSDGLIVLPYFSGERMPLKDPLAKGVFFGLNLRHTRGHLIHAAFEGIGFGIEQNFENFRKLGIKTDVVTAVGGGTKSPLWLQIVSDINGFAQKVPEITVGASYGDALMAGLGIGAIKKPEDIESLIKIKYIVEPDLNKYEKYKEYKEIYKELYLRNKDIMHKLS